MSAREILSTPRLTLREMDEGDFDALCAILQDETVMAAYAHAFSDQEVRAWLQNQRRRYARYGFGLWAMLEKETGDMIGQCGLSMQKTPEREVLEVGYLLRRDRWGHGLATEAARACRDYAFDVLGAPGGLFHHSRQQPGLPARRPAQRHAAVRRVCQALLGRGHAPHRLLRAPRIARRA